MAEEAISSALNHMIGSIQDGHGVPSYRQLLRDDKVALTPAHPDSTGRAWTSLPEADLPITQSLYDEVVRIHTTSAW